MTVFLFNWWSHFVELYIWQPSGLLFHAFIFCAVLPEFSVPFLRFFCVFLPPGSAFIMAFASAFIVHFYNYYEKYENVNYLFFVDINGNKQTVSFMSAEEQIYLDDGNATGFMKPYKNDRYSFAALLPNEGISINEYIETLTGTKLINTLNNAENATVYTSMPNGCNVKGRHSTL